MHFMQEVAPKHAELLILGDLFEYWCGDDDDDAVARDVIAALARLSGTGKRLFVMHGNRDLLIGAQFCAATGATLLTDPCVAHIARMGAVLLSHGDAWCTEDVAYQRFRSQVRNPEWQRQFLAQDLAARKAFIEHARTQSESAKQQKSMEIMDVTAAEIRRAFIEHGVTRIVHGHTHRCATHHSEIDGSARERWVLPDWDFENQAAPRGGYLRVSEGAFVLEPVLGVGAGGTAASGTSH